MAKRWNHEREALRRARQRLRELELATPVETAPGLVPGPSTPEVVLRRTAASTCAWCDGPIERKARGRIPKWCSAACRQRAWEQNRAAESGRSAVQVVERLVEIPRRHPRHDEWVTLLYELTEEIENGTVYDRDLPAIGEASVALNNALAQRLTGRHR